jgi:hypothetical protein
MDLPGKRIYETPADYYARVARDEWMARARAAGRLRFQCPDCYAIRLEAGRCACDFCVGDAYAYAIHHEPNPRRRVARDEEGCDEARCLTSLSRKCKCRCNGMLHGTEEATAE